MTACPIGEEQVAATYIPNWLGSRGIVELPEGRTFLWNEGDSCGDQYRFKAIDGTSLVAIEPDFCRPEESCVFEMQATVEISPRGYALSELPLLVLMGWYVIVTRKEDVALAAPPF